MSDIDDDIDHDEHNELALRTQWIAEARKQTLETLPAFLQKLADYPHTYGTICRAIAAGAIGAARALDQSAHGGITGFQAGAIMWDFCAGWLHWSGRWPRPQARRLRQPPLPTVRSLLQAGDLQGRRRALEAEGP